MAQTDNQEIIMSNNPCCAESKIQLYVGDTVIKHDIPDNTEIEVKNGRLDIQGNVGNSVKIFLKNDHLISFTSNEGKITINDVSCAALFNENASSINLENINGKINLNRQTIIDNSDNQNYGVSISGNLGNNISIKSDSSIHCNADIGNECVLTAKKSIIIKGDMGKGGSLLSEEFVSTGNIGDDVKIQAYGFIEIKKIGNNCTLNSNHAVTINDGYTPNKNVSIKASQIAFCL